MNYGKVIELNGRIYTVLDTGEGPCDIIIVDNLVRYMSVLALPKHRLLVVDVSLSMTDATTDIQRSKMIADDIHLLLDIYWLDEVTISCQIKNVDTLFFKNMLAQRAHARKLRKM